MNLKSSFVSQLNRKYPQLNVDDLNTLVSENLISPFQVSLKPAQIEKLRNEIKKYWNLRSWSQKNLQNQYDSMGLARPQNYAVCMSYDFHINAEGEPELIEINTNAAFLALGLELLELLKLPNISADFNENSLVEMFRQELQLTGRSTQDVAIIDENPEQQRLYIEFLIYQNILNKHGIKTDILNFNEIEKIRRHSLVYNRYTDFYLQENASTELKKAFNADLNFSPNPYEYFLLADKQRLIDWNSQTEVEKPASLLKIYDLGIESKDKIWAERKHLFIKPKNSYGSKQAYKAASISRKTFDEVCNSNFIAQQLSAPSEIEVTFEDQPQKFKYDLRCYAYRDDLQLIVARLYQGQTTNLKTPGGGFAVVVLAQA